MYYCRYRFVEFFFSDFQQDGGGLLCAIDEGNDHNISVWDWQKSDKGHKITETKVRAAARLSERNERRVNRIKPNNNR